MSTEGRPLRCCEVDSPPWPGGVNGNGGGRRGGVSVTGSDAGSGGNCSGNAGGGWFEGTGKAAAGGASGAAGSTWS